MPSPSSHLFVASLGLGLASSSLAFWGNVGLRLVGHMPIVSSPSLRAKNGIDHRQATKLFAGFYRGAAPIFVTSILTTVVSLVVAARHLPILSDASRLQRLLYSSAASTALMIPTTLLLLAPINKRLLAIADADADSQNGATKDPLTEQEENKVQQDLQRWIRFNDVRMACAGLGWGLAAWAAIVA